MTLLDDFSVTVELPLVEPATPFKLGCQLTPFDSQLIPVVPRKSRYRGKHRPLSSAAGKQTTASKPSVTAPASTLCPDSTVPSGYKTHSPGSSGVSAAAIAPVVASLASPPAPTNGIGQHQ